MFDWVGHRHYGYIFSGVLTVVCMLFMLSTFIPNAGLGLQFSIAYTGGTVWEVHFQDGTPDPNEVRAILEGLGHAGSDVAITGGKEREYVLIRTQALALEAPTVSEGSAAAAAEASASPDASAAASAAPAAAIESAAASAAPAAAIESAAASAAPAAAIESARCASLLPTPRIGRGRLAAARRLASRDGRVTGPRRLRVAGSRCWRWFHLWRAHQG